MVLPWGVVREVLQEPQHPPGARVTPEYGRFFLGPNRTVGPNPSDEANRCILRHVTQKPVRKALYAGHFESGHPLQVVYFGCSQFPFPEAPLGRRRFADSRAGQPPSGAASPNASRAPCRT